MIKKKKNSFWTFIFSFWPGAAEMYMGFMKMGVSLMAAFVAIIALGSIVETGPVLFLSLIVWFYGFFHARNLAALDNEELRQIEDHYLFIEDDVRGREIWNKYRKWIAAIFILLGVSMIWKNLLRMLGEFIPNEYMSYVYSVGYKVPKFAVAIVIILIGVKMIAGKKEELEHDTDDTTDADTKSVAGCAAENAEETRTEENVIE